MKKRDRTTGTGSGIAIGVALGASFGLLWDNLALGMALGLALGVAIGASMSEDERDGQKRDDASEKSDSGPAESDPESPGKCT